VRRLADEYLDIVKTKEEVEHEHGPERSDEGMVEEGGIPAGRAGATE
jgi:hypothetical protein